MSDTLSVKGYSRGNFSVSRYFSSYPRETLQGLSSYSTVKTSVLSEKNIGSNWYSFFTSGSSNIYEPITDSKSGEATVSFDSAPVSETYRNVVQQNQPENDLVEQLVNSFIQVASSDSTKFGDITRSDDLLQEIAFEFPDTFSEFLANLVAKAYSSPKVLIVTLKAMGKLVFDYSYSSAFAFAMAAYSHRNPIVKEAVIQLIEKWAHPKGLDFLKNCDAPPVWLEQYRQKVIAELQETFG